MYTTTKTIKSMAKLTDAQREECAKQYEQLQNKLTRIAHRYANGNRSNSDDNLADCGSIFVAEFAKQSNIPFDRRVQMRARTELLDKLRANKVRATQELPACEEPQDKIRSTDNYDRILESLSSDAKHVVQLLMNTPSDIFWMLSIDTDKPAKKIKKHLHETLKDLGWAKSRINRAFTNIRQAIA